MPVKLFPCKLSVTLFPETLHHCIRIDTGAGLREREREREKERERKREREVQWYYWIFVLSLWVSYEYLLDFLRGYIILLFWDVLVNNHELLVLVINGNILDYSYCQGDKRLLVMLNENYGWFTSCYHVLFLQKRIQCFPEDWFEDCNPWGESLGGNPTQRRVSWYPTQRRVSCYLTQGRVSCYLTHRRVSCYLIKRGVSCYLTQG